MSLTRPSTPLLLRLFPPPRFLTMPSVGIDISDSSVKFLELIGAPGHLKIGRFGERTIPSGIVEAGQIKDSERLAEVLVQLRKEEKIEYIRAGLPEEEAYLFHAQVPESASAAEARTVIEFQLEENVPITSAEAVFDYEPTGKEIHEGQREVIVSVYPLSLVSSYREAFEKAGMIPLSFEVEAQAIARSIVPLGSEKTYFIVDFGRARTGLAVVSRGVLLFTATIEVGGVAMTQAIMKTFKVDEREAERLKNERGFTRSQTDTELWSALMNTIAALKDEINRHFVYWNSRKGADNKQYQKIDELLLCGGNSNLTGLPEYLSQSLKVPVRLGAVWGNALSFNDVIPPIDKSHSLGYATAVGLALRTI